MVIAIAVAPLLLCSRCTLLLVTQYPPSHVCPLLCDPLPSPYIQLLRTLHGPQAYEMARARSMTGAEGGAAAGAGGGGGGGGVGGGGGYPGPGDGGGAGASTQTGFGGADMPPPQGDGACVCSALVTGALFEKTHMPMSRSGYICCLRLAALHSCLACVFWCHLAVTGLHRGASGMMMHSVPLVKQFSFDYDLFGSAPSTFGGSSTGDCALLHMFAAFAQQSGPLWTRYAARWSFLLPLTSVERMLTPWTRWCSLSTCSAAAACAQTMTLHPWSSSVNGWVTPLTTAGAAAGVVADPA